MHRDLRPENIMVEPETLQIKVLNFDSSSYFSAKSDLNTCLGSPYYVAPEVLGGKYNKESDVWSIGVLCYLMLTGCPPFQDEDHQRTYYKILKEPVKF